MKDKLSPQYYIRDNCVWIEKSTIIRGDIKLQILI